MASVTGYTAARMQEIENAAIIDGEVVAGNLILTRFDTTTINAGSVIGPTGPAGTSTLGTVAYAETASAQTGITTVADLTTLTTTFTAVAGRRYKITGVTRVVQNTSAANNILSITDGAGTEINNSFLSIPAGSNGFHVAIAVIVPGAGSKTFKLRLSTSAGTTQTAPSATAKSFILVEDIGV